MLPVSVNADFSRSLHSASLPGSRPNSEAASWRTVDFVEQEDQVSTHFSADCQDHHRQQIVADSQFGADILQGDLAHLVERDGDQPVRPAAHGRRGVVRGRHEQFVKGAQRQIVVATEFGHRWFPQQVAIAALLESTGDLGRDIEDQHHAAIAEDAGARDARDIFVVFGDRLDDHVFFADHAVDGQADFLARVADDDQGGIRRLACLARCRHGGSPADRRA